MSLTLTPTLTLLKAHLRDGAALAHGFSWLWRSVAAEGRALTEMQVSAKLRACRAEQRGFLDVSFPTIAGSGANGAIIHYNCEAVARARARAAPSTARPMRPYPTRAPTLTLTPPSPRPRTLTLTLTPNPNPHP